MAISDTSNTIQYNGNGSVATFSTGTIKFYAQSDLIVVVTDIATSVDTTLTLGVDYTVSGGSGEAGSITLTAGNLATGKRLTIIRSIPFTQTDDYVEGGNILADTIETGFDKAVVRDQQLRDGINRSLKFSATLPSGLVGNITQAPSDNNLLAWDGVSGDIKNVVVASLTGSVDTIFSGLANGDFLQYNGTAWENVAASDVQADLGVGNIKVSSNDTTAGFLEGKLLGATDVFSFSTQNDGANETRTINVNDAIRASVHGGVQLRNNAGDLTLFPYLGGLLDINGTLVQVPAAGWVVDDTSATNDTTYYIYATTTGVEYSATAYEFDSDTGIPYQIGEPSKVLVGMARYGTGAWETSDLLVRSYYNRKQSTVSNQFTTSRSTTSTSLAEINSEIRVNYIRWADEKLRINLLGTMYPSGDITTGAGLSIGGSSPVRRQEIRASSVAQQRGTFSLVYDDNVTAEGILTYATCFGGNATAGTLTFNAGAFNSNTYITVATE